MEYTKNELLQHVLFLAQYLKKSDTDLVIALELMDLGFANKYHGTQYLKTAISLFYEDPTQLVVDGLYAAVAKVHGGHTTKVQVEASIRRAIQKAWKNGNPDNWKVRFPEEAMRRKSPSNAGFITRMIDILALWQECLNSSTATDGEVDDHEAE